MLGFRDGMAAAALAIGLSAAIGCSADDANEPTAAPPLSEQELSCPDSSLSPAPLRRLTRFEFANSVRDVFGIDLPLAELFPRDELALGFDNQAGTLSVTDLHVQGYLDAANVVADWLTSDAERLRDLTGCALDSEACARSFLARLGQRIERRDLVDAELDSLLGLFGADFSEAGFREGSARAVAALLQNPEFVYRLERAPQSFATERQASSPWTLATRLSFLFWGSGPDQRLLDVVARGELVSRADVEREARQLLADPRARRGVLHFYVQWLDLSDFDEVEKDQRLFSYWDESLRSDLGKETTRFLESVLWEDDARLETLLTAPYSFTNAVLKDFYGLPLGNPDARELERTSLTGVPGRAGILTHGSILSTQAKANQTDPIHRGKFIREQFFCSPPPPPPPALVVSPPTLDARKTTRERFSEHRDQAACAFCHEKLDPVGFLFEHYDAIGRYRDTEAGLLVDASGYLADTDIEGPMNGAIELSNALAHSGEVKSCVIKQWFRYTFGRGETEQDSCTLAKLEQTFDQSRGNLGELLVALTQTDPFLYDTPAPPAEELDP